MAEVGKEAEKAIGLKDPNNNVTPPDGYDFTGIDLGKDTSSSSIKKPMSSIDLSNVDTLRDILENNVNSYGSKKNVDEGLIDSIMNHYGNSLESIGLNFDDPLKAYSKKFNKNMQTLGLDPQRPGNSYAFFTRPDLNISKGNVQRMPFLNYSLNTTIGKIVSSYLMYPDADVTNKLDIPDQIRDWKDKSNYVSESLFDPLKSNLCKEISGLKDMVMDKHDTKLDFAGHQLTYASGADGYDSIGEVSLVFEDAHRSPMFLNHFLHFQYIQEVSKGNIHPRLKYIRNRVLDYTMSIYLFKLAEDNETILRFAKLTGCFPISVPMDTLNHSRESKAEEFDSINVTYAYNMYEPMNPSIIADFNWLAMQTASTQYKNNTNNQLIPSGDGFKRVIPFKEGTVGVLNDFESQSRLIENVDFVRSRSDSLWATTPIIEGNKLLFI